MKVTILQHDIVWGRPDLNRQRLEQQILLHPGSDLYVLTEMWPTGFVTQTEDMTEKGEASLQWMKQMAIRLNAAIAGSIATEDNGLFYNRFYFTKPDNTFAYYDKRHLFTYGGEDQHYTPGLHRTVVEWRGIRLLLQVCYDLRFPVWSRNRWDNARQCADYDAILYVANWPKSRIAAWDTLLRARAIENQCYVIGVNRVGDDPNCSYCGGSAIIDPRGNLLATCPTDSECIFSAEIDKESLLTFRQKFPVLHDADNFSTIPI